MQGVTAQPEKQPRGLYLLFGVEMWERFSFYGMKALLVLFLTSTVGGGFGWTKEEATAVYKWYTGLVYLTPLLGGYLADRFLGTHRAIIIGSFIIAAGHFLLAVPGKTTFFLGLAFIILGTGFHKSNISTMVGQLFRPGDGRRDAGFTIFYVGINVGATLGPLVCGWLAKDSQLGWHWAFAASGVGMMLGTITYLVFKRSWLGDVGDRPADRPTKQVVAHAPLTVEQKQQIGVIAILAIFNIFFWSAYEQTGSSMAFFAEERTRRMLWGLEIPAPWFQSINPVVILVFAPLFAILWMKLGAQGREPSTPVKFTVALVLLALGFGFMVVAGRISDGGVKVSPLWLVAAYCFHTWGEICLYPVSLSMVTKLAPPRFASLLMGFWFFSMASAEFLAGHLAGMATKVEQGHYFHVFGGQADFFLIFVIMPAVAAVVLIAVTPVLEKLMHGRA